jgi:hypothetical protein
MNTKPVKTFITIFFIGFLLENIACNSLSHQYKEGKIIYNITYEMDKHQNPIVIILPKQMTTYFKDDKTITTLEGFFGTFKMSLITRPDLNKKYVLLRILDKKYIYETEMDGPEIGFDQMKDLHIKILDTTFIYKNLKCHKALVYCPAIAQDTFELIYTDQLKIRNPNVNTPFSKIPGIILKTKLNLLGIIMNIEISQFTPENVDNTLFQIPENYQNVSRETLEQIIKSFQK